MHDPDRLFLVFDRTDVPSTEAKNRNALTCLAERSCRKPLGSRSFRPCRQAKSGSACQAYSEELPASVGLLAHKCFLSTSIGPHALRLVVARPFCHRRCSSLVPSRPYSISSI